MGRKTGYTVFLEPEDIKFLEEISRKTGRSRSSLIREAVKFWISKQKPREE